MTDGDDALVELAPQRMVAGGSTLARDADGRVVFVSGALPGERVSVRVTEKRRDFSRAVTVHVIEPSGDRVAPPCPRVADGCGGCQWQHVEPAAQSRLKEEIVADALRRIAKIAEPPLRPTVALPASGYRTSARFGVTEAGRLAFRRFHDHRLVEPDGCLVLHPSLAEVVATARFPSAREVTLRAGARTGERLAFARPSAAGAVVPDGVAVADDRRTGHYHEVAAGRRWRISSRSFFQARPDGADALAALVAAGAGAGDGRRAADLYAGVGLFAGVLSDHGWSVVAVEGATSAAADARHNVVEAKVVKADVAAWVPSPVDLVVADPSRAGLGSAGAATVAGCGADTVVLVSCDPAALARDAALLTGHGYRLDHVTPVDLFPHTFHIEAVSVYRRT